MFKLKENNENINILIDSNKNIVLNYLFMIDFGVSSSSFMDSFYVYNHNFKIITLTRPRELQMFDGVLPQSGTMH